MNGEEFLISIQNKMVPERIVDYFTRKKCEHALYKFKKKSQFRETKTINISN